VYRVNIYQYELLSVRCGHEGDAGRQHPGLADQRMSVGMRREQEERRRRPGVGCSGSCCSPGVRFYSRAAEDRRTRLTY